MNNKFNSLKFGIGPMSLNVIQALIEFCQEQNKENVFAFIPSRRQIEFNGGYVNNWTTKQFSEYIKNNSNIIIQRDHGGPYQGLVQSFDGLQSLVDDIRNGFDLIHVDPWKMSKNVSEAAKNTIGLIKYCELISSGAICYEIGTEEAIFKYSPSELDEFVSLVVKGIGDEVFERVVFIVVQSGTNVKGISNLGKFDKQRCIEMVEVCKKYEKKNKEHNADYLLKEDISIRFESGIDCLNIAPELGFIETVCYMEQLENYSMFSLLKQFEQLCFNSKKWEKWIVGGMVPSKEEICKICGHYLFSNPEFLRIKNLLSEKCDIDLIVKNKLKEKYGELVSCLKVK